MHIEKVYERLAEKIHAERIRKNEPMAKHTSFKIGGPVDLMVLPSDIEELRHVLKVCREMGIDFYVMGNGSNLLVRDKGVRGVIIKIGGDYSKVSVQEKSSGHRPEYPFEPFKIALEHHLEDLSLPAASGSLGGAVVMNAGAYGRNERYCKSGYRNGSGRKSPAIEQSRIEFWISKKQDAGREWIVLEVEIQLKRRSRSNFVNYPRSTQRRTAKQPLHQPSAGSVFKRPANHYASKLIEDAGLKGVRFGERRIGTACWIYRK